MKTGFEGEHTLYGCCSPANDPIKKHTCLKCGLFEDHRGGGGRSAVSNEGRQVRLRLFIPAGL